MARCCHGDQRWRPVAKETNSHGNQQTGRTWDDTFEMPRLTVDLLARCTGHATKRRKDETQEQFLAKITHLYCSEKGLESIVSPHHGHNTLNYFYFRRIFIIVVTSLYCIYMTTR